MSTLAVPNQGGVFTLPYDDVVLFAAVHVSNMIGKHPYHLVQTFARRPAFMSWVTGNTACMSYPIMRQLIIKLVNDYGVTFGAEGFTYKGNYTRARGYAPPAITANPSAL